MPKKRRHKQALALSATRCIVFQVIQIPGIIPLAYRPPSLTDARTKNRVSLHFQVMRNLPRRVRGRIHFRTSTRYGNSSRLDMRYFTTSTSPLDYAKRNTRGKNHTSARARTRARAQLRSSASTWKRATAVNVRPFGRSGELRLAPPAASADAARGESPLPSLYHSSSLLLALTPSRFKRDSHDILSLSRFVVPFFSTLRAALLYSPLPSLFPTCRPPDALFHGRRRSLLSPDDLLYRSNTQPTRSLFQL